VAGVLLFHHVQGLTPGVVAFADELRAAGHTVHTPDLFEGRTFETIEDGLGYVREIGFGTVSERGAAAAEDVPDDVVYAGFSLGAMPAQMLAQTRPGARGALLFHSAIPPEEFGGPWPEGVPAQIHIMEQDEFALEGDLEVAQALAGNVDGIELFLYPGDAHLFADSSLPEYDEGATELLTQRVLAFLD
jgi:dienelactone hydrolase